MNKLTTEREYPGYPVLLVDDEPAVLENYDYTLYSAGINNFHTLNDSLKVMEFLDTTPVSIIVLDLMMPHLPGSELLLRITDRFPDSIVIVVTAMDDVKTAVSCMKRGAFDYLVKPVDNELLVSTIKRALERREQLQELTMLKNSILDRGPEKSELFSRIITRNSLMFSLFRYIKGIAKTSFAVLITGETGVGKEEVAKVIHRASGRRGDFIPVNSAGLSDQVLEDTLFGHRRGAFTGAESDRAGLIATADGGTLFLDEIGEMGDSAQIKLLRFLQDRTYYPLGSDRAEFCDVRIIAATNYTIESLQNKSSFRRDLFYRLQTHAIEVPPLRERREDIPILVDHFIEKAAESLGKKKPPIPIELYTMLNNYAFPGNVRELQGMAYDAVSVFNNGRLSLEPFRKRIGNGNHYQPMPATGSQDSIKNHTESPVEFNTNMPPLKDIEKLAIEEALRRTNGNQTQAADLLGVTRKALSSRLVRMRKSN